MDATIGQRTYAPKPQQFIPAMQDAVVSASEETGRKIDLAVRQLIDEGAERTYEILKRRRSDLAAGVELLIS